MSKLFDTSHVATRLTVKVAPAERLSILYRFWEKQTIPFIGDGKRTLFLTAEQNEVDGATEAVRAERLREQHDTDGSARVVDGSWGEGGRLIASTQEKLGRGSI